MGRKSTFPPFSVGECSAAHSEPLRRRSVGVVVEPARRGPRRGGRARRPRRGSAPSTAPGSRRRTGSGPCRASTCSAAATAGSRFGDHADVISRRFRYLIISRIAVSHHGSAPWIMHSFSSGKRYAHPVEVDRVLRLAGERRAGDAGVHAEREVELAALRVQRVVDGVGRRVHAVAPEARADRRSTRPGGRARTTRARAPSASGAAG